MKLLNLEENKTKYNVNEYSEKNTTNNRMSLITEKTNQELLANELETNKVFKSDDNKAIAPLTAKFNKTNR